MEHTTHTNNEEQAIDLSVLLRRMLRALRRLWPVRQTAGRAVVACDSNSAGTLGQVFPSQQVRLNEQRQQGNAAQRGRDASEQRRA